MFIKSLDLKNYRNYKELHIDFDNKTNLFYGDNAQGKTNILEAVYLCSTAKSHRGNKDKELIKFDEEEAHIRAGISREGIENTIDIHIKNNKTKGIAINSVPIKRASELFGLMNVVCFSPEDLDIIKDGPAVRRKFLDMELCQLNRIYVHSLINYNKTLIQKNRLLKEAGYKEINEVLDIYDSQLREFGREISESRNEFINDLNEMIRDIHFNLSGEEIRLVYEKNEFKDMRNEEIRQKNCLSGPHRDDIGIYVNDIDVRKFGSQGQQRTAALSLKLSEIELVKKKIKDDPILLLDDVLSELDSKRQNRLLKVINDIQTIITCTGVEEFINNNFSIAKIMKVENGTVGGINE